MISGTNQNRGTCAIMSESSCCSHCGDTASGPPPEGWQAEVRGCGMSYADEGSGRYVGRQAFKPDFKQGSGLQAFVTFLYTSIYIFTHIYILIYVYVYMVPVP